MENFYIHLNLEPSIYAKNVVINRVFALFSTTPIMKSNIEFRIINELGTNYIHFPNDAIPMIWNYNS